MDEQERIPVDVAAGVMVGVLQGLHAAHEAKDERGESLHIVHRDVSPQNIMVGADGVPRLIDFGVARAVGRLQTTGAGQIKGKLDYMSPEQLFGDALDRRSDIYSAGVVLVEMLAGCSMSRANNGVLPPRQGLGRGAVPPSTYSKDVPPDLDIVVMRALAREPERRFSTAKQMATAIEEASRLAGATQIVACVEELAGPMLAARSKRTREIECGQHVGPRLPGTGPWEVAAQLGADSPDTSRALQIDPLDDRLASPRPENTASSNGKAPPERPLWRERLWAFITVGLIVVCAVAGFRLVTLRTSTEASRAPASIPEASPRAIGLLDLPRPATKDANALTMYVSGLQAMHDASSDLASQRLLDAAARDPSLAAAHLRYALAAYFPVSDGPRKHFNQGPRPAADAERLRRDVTRRLGTDLRPPAAGLGRV